MRKKIIISFLALAAVFSVVFTLNINVTTRQGVNFKVHSLKIPLYLKVLDFFDRHYNYKWVLGRIVKDITDDQDKVLKIFIWTHQNIRKAPAGFPIVDDHVWHTIIRGYGIDDQSADVFTTLCNYARSEAFFNWINGQSPEDKITLSFVKIKGRVYVFDPYNGVYFKNSKKELADFDDIAEGDWIIESIGQPGGAGIDYAPYLKNIRSMDRIELTRSNTQSPLNRLKYEIEKIRGKYLRKGKDKE